MAVVGNRPVLASQVDEELFSRQAQGVKLPDDAGSSSTRCAARVVSSIVDEELLVQQALRDTSIQVTDQEIADGVEQQVRKVRGQLHVRGGLQGTSSGRRGSRRRRSTAAGSPISSGAPRCRIG